jgi:hypothetical protein
LVEKLADVLVEKLADELAERLVASTVGEMAEMRVDL